MGQRGKYDWEDKKEEILARKNSGILMVDLAETILDFNETLPAFYKNQRYPLQLRAIGPYEGKLFTVVIEDRSDKYGEWVHISNFWPASKIEIDIFRRAHQ